MRFTPVWPPGGSVVFRQDFYLLKSSVQRVGGGGGQWFKFIYTV